MLSAEVQLRRIEAQLLGSGGTLSGDVEILIDSRDLTGILNVDLTFPTGHVLSVSLAVDVSYGYPAWSKYGFHFRDGQDRTVFRYDNSPHHPLVTTAPDHKHVGPEERVEAHHRPNLPDLIEEVWSAIAPEMGGPPIVLIGSHLAPGEPRPRVGPEGYAVYATLREQHAYLAEALLIRDVIVVAFDQPPMTEYRVAVQVDLEDRPDISDLGRVLTVEGGGGGKAGWSFGVGAGHRLAIRNCTRTALGGVRSQRESGFG